MYCFDTKKNQSKFQSHPTFMLGKKLLDRCAMCKTLKTHILTLIGMSVFVCNLGYVTVCIQLLNL